MEMFGEEAWATLHVLLLMISIHATAQHEMSSMGACPQHDSQLVAPLCLLLLLLGSSYLV